MNKKNKKIIRISTIIICLSFILKINNVFALNCNEIPETMEFIKDIYKMILIIVPILIVVFSTIDFVKALMAQKDDDMKKAYGNFIKRLIIGVIIVFAPPLINFFINLIGIPTCMW